MTYRKIFQDVFMIRKLLVVQHEACLPIFEMDLNSTIKIDPSILCDFLQAETPIEERKIDEDSTITKIKYHSFEIINATFSTYSVYLFSERELDKEMDLKVLELANWFNLIFGFDTTEGEYSKEFADYYRESIQAKVLELFDFWLLYPLELNEVVFKNSNITDSIEQKIVSNVKESYQTSVMKLLHDFKELDDEVVLQRIYDLVNKEIIKTSVTDDYTQTFFSLDTNYV